MMPKISMISALGENKVIGNKNSIPWHLPADFKYFKEQTIGKTIVMGLNTFKSIGERPLPGRKHIILTLDKSYKAPENCVVVNSFEQAMDLIRREKDEVMICGGASIYKQFLPFANKLYLTYIHHTFDGDTYFPDFNEKEWKEIKRIDHKADDKNKYDYSFTVLERI